MLCFDNKIKTLGVLIKRMSSVGSTGGRRRWHGDQALGGPSRRALVPSSPSRGSPPSAAAVTNRPPCGGRVCEGGSGGIGSPGADKNGSRRCLIVGCSSEAGPVKPVGNDPRWPLLEGEAKKGRVSVEKREAISAIVWQQQPSRSPRAASRLALRHEPCRPAARAPRCPSDCAALSIVRREFLVLALGDAHHLDGVTDHVGRALLAFRSIAHCSSMLGAKPWESGGACDRLPIALQGRTQQCLLT